MKNHRHLIIPIATLAALLGIRSAHTASWNDPLGGNFNDAGNWSSPSAVPGSGDQALFGQAATYTVALPAGTTTNSEIRVTDGTVTFDLTAGHYTATTFTVGRTNSATLIVQNGTMISVGTTTIGYDSGLTGNLTLTGPAARQEWNPPTGSGSFLVGHNTAIGNFLIENGADFVTTGNREIAVGTDGGTGKITVTGMGSSFAHTGGATWVGGRSAGSVVTGTGTLDVLSGGQASVGTMVIAGKASTTGTVKVSGAGSALVSTATISVGGSSTASSGGNGSLLVENGGNVSTAGIVVWNGDQLSVSDGTIETVTLSLTSSTLAFKLFDASSTPAIDASGAVTLSSASLSLSLDSSFVFSAGAVFTILEYGSLSGAFLGIADEDIVSIGGYDFEVGYGDGSNDRLTLTAVPEPGTVSLILGMGIVTMALRRSRGGSAEAKHRDLPSGAFRPDNHQGAN
jgi:T5SS/PEP-CTERM-associated repeat protein